jgi:hypothetical protein
VIAKPNLQARCENFHLITIYESTRCGLALAAGLHSLRACKLAFAMSGKQALNREKHRSRFINADRKDSYISPIFFHGKSNVELF